MREATMSMQTDGKKTVVPQDASVSAVADCSIESRNREMADQIGNKCIVCNAVQDNVEQLLKHMRSHNPPLPVSSSRLQRKRYRCNVCGKQFVNVSNLAEHYAVHAKDKPFKCPKCHLALKTARRFIKHFREVHVDGVRPKCPQCDYTSKWKSNLRRHIRGHSCTERMERCEVCFKMICPERLEIHYMRHTGERPFPCSQCGKAYRKKGSLARHVKEKHVGQSSGARKSRDRTSSAQPKASTATDGTRGFIMSPKSCEVAAQLGNECIVCHKTMGDEINFLDHMKQHNPSVTDTPSRLPNGCYQCSVCRKEFVRRCNVIKHYFTHSKAKPFRCPKCQFSFKTSLDFILHFRRAHIDTPRFKCDKCDFITKRKDSLRNHIFRHSAEGHKERCEVCFKKVSSRWLVNHYMFHTGERPFRCDQCGVGYRAKYHLLRHTGIKHRKKSTQRRPSKARGHNPRSSPWTATDATKGSTISYKSDEILVELGNKCIVCKKPLGYGINFLDHLKSHDPFIPTSSYSEDCRLPNGLYECIVCGRQFLRKVTLCRHYKIHTEERPFRCPKCSSAFKTATSFTEHFRHAHVERPLLQCQKCAFRTKWKRALQNHMLQHSPKGDKERCEVCFKLFSCRSLKRHYFVHTREKLYKCNECGAQYSRKEGLHQHIRRIHIDGETKA